MPKLGFILFYARIEKKKKKKRKKEEEEEAGVIMVLIQKFGNQNNDHYSALCSPH